MAVRQFSTASRKINEFVVVGGGLMGSGIAQVGVQTGHKVTLVDISNEVLEKSKKRIEDGLRRASKKQEDPSQFMTSCLDNLHITSSIEKPLSTADLLVEAVVENMEVKKSLFGQWDKMAPEKTIFASNTSSLSIGEIATSTNRKGRFGGLHFFNPVPLMKLLEVVRTSETSQETFASMIEWGKAMGKATVECKDTSGFIVNRLLIPYIMEAFRMLERQDASSKDIDTAMKLGAGYPMGPFQLADYVGLDTLKFILDGWHKADSSHPLFQPSPMLDKLVKEGKHGVKSGQGIYTYEKKTK